VRRAVPFTRQAAAAAGELAAAAVLSCGGERSPAPTRAAPAAVNAESLRAAARAESVAAARDEWNEPEVVKRLTEAGLVVTERGDTVRQPFLRVPGARLTVSRSELQIYIYPDARARAADSQRLDTATAAPRGAPSPWGRRARLVAAGNLLAIHLTDDDLLAERVANALTARHLGGAP
jgi:hypothetical protein